MQQTGSPSDLEKRLAALWEYRIMDTPPEEVFDDLTRLTAFICGTPIAMVTFLDARRQWFKASIGVSHTEDPLEHSFCAHAIKHEKIFLINDAAKDARFANNPLVTQEKGIRFYAGAPLVTPQGAAIGTICAIDRVPRELSNEQQEALTALARQTITALELRRTVKQLNLALTEKTAAKQEASALRDLLPVCAWCHKVRDDQNYWTKLEDYLSTVSGARISHGACPECAKKFTDKLVPSIEPAS